MIDTLNQRADEHYEASIGDIGWTQKYEMQVENATVALISLRNDGGGEYSVDVWTAMYTNGFLEKLTLLVEQSPSDGGAWTDDEWEAVQALFHYHFSTSAG